MPAGSWRRLARRLSETFRGGSSNDNGTIYSFCNSPFILRLFPCICHLRQISLQHMSKLEGFSYYLPWRYLQIHPRAFLRFPVHRRPYLLLCELPSIYFLFFILKKAYFLIIIKSLRFIFLFVKYNFNIHLYHLFILIPKITQLNILGMF